MAQPPKDIQAKLRQMADEERIRKQLKDQYQAEMAKRYERDVVPFTQWMSQRKPEGMAKGGSVMGINVASDRKADRRYADLIVDGHKTLESRNSDTLRPYVGKRVAIVRTGEGQAKAIGEVTIGEPMVVNKQKFRALEDKHHVPEGSAFDISTPTKHLYPMHDPVRYDKERDVGHGIVSRKVITMAGGGRVKEPKSTVKAYKLFRVHPDHPGKLFPLFVDANTPVEMNKWVDAKEGEMANGKVKSKLGPLAYRPGWHAGDLPIATHIGEKSDSSLPAPDTRPANHAWAEVEMPDDVDWQSVANERGTNAQGKLVPVKAHITDQIPKGGHYRYKTNPNMTGNWLIGGSMKVNRVLSDAEVSKINRAAGLADLPRAQPFKKKAFGFAEGGAVGPQEWMAEEHVNHMADGGPMDYSKRENQDMADPEYRRYLEQKQALERDYTDFALAGPLVKGITGLANLAGRAMAPEVAAGPVITTPIGWKIRVPSRETFGEYSMPPPAVFNPRTAEEIAATAAKKLPQKLKNIFLEDIPRNVASAAGSLQAIVNRYQETQNSQKKAEGGSAQAPNMDTMKLALMRNSLGMHSPLEKALINVPRTKGTAQEFMTEASKQPGFRKEELEDRQIPMPEGKLTKEEFVKHVQKNRGKSILVDVRHSNIEDEGRRIDETHHEQDLTLPGGENYREVLLKQPKWPKFSEDKLMGYEAQLRRTENPTTRSMLERDIQQLREQKAKVGEVFPGVPQHFGGEPGIIASLRLKDRVGPNGEKILHVEEVQSDWHQQGRKEGYQTTESSQNLAAAKSRHQDFLNSMKEKYGGEGLQYTTQMTPEEKQRARDLNIAAGLALTKAVRGVPDAPHKKSWHELALKHALTEAVEGGYHGIAITPGEAQAKRYDLSKKVNNLLYFKNDDGTYHVQANLDVRGGESHVMGQNIKPEELDSYVGKEVANKMREGVGITSESGSVRGKPAGVLEAADLQVGGEGMKGFYDKMIPDFLNKLGKKHGAQVQPGTISIKTTPAQHHGISQDQFDEAPYDAQSRMISQHAYATQGAKQDVPVHYFPITDSLRQQIKTEGLPQYQAGGMIHKADGGAIQGKNMNPTMAQMRASLLKKPIDVRSVGVQEAIGLSPKLFISPDAGTPRGTLPPPGGVATPSGMPIGGIDMSMQPGQQLMPQTLQPQQQAPQGGQPQGGLPGQPQMAPDQPSNILQMTPQGRAMGAMTPPQMPQTVQKTMGMAKGGTPKSVEEMKTELAASKDQGKRITINAQGSGGVKGIIVPRHTLEGNAKVGAVGLHEMNQARAQVYGSHHRDPLTINKIGLRHKSVLEDHFKKPLDEQLQAEEEALNRLRQAKHIGRTANTLDESEKLDTVRHEHDEEGRTHVGYASKGVAGHALYTTGSGKDTKYQVINTCPGQTEGCGGGKDAQGIVDTMKGTCFAPNAESQYAGAATRRAAHEQAKHDPEMTNDWILAHTGSLRNVANKADKNNQRLLFRPNVVDETDVSSRHVIRHLNEQRKANGKPAIIANSYGKTNELHDPENGYYVTHSNVGPKVKKGKEISENIGRDKARVRNTIMAADNKGDFKNEQGNLTPPKGSYMVTDVKRGSPLAQNMQKAITHAKYWTAGRGHDELSQEEKDEGPEGHFSGAGRPTTEDKAHYGHRTVNGMRYDYQKQHILHPRLVQVGSNTDGTPHMIPTDSRFKDTEFLPKNRFKTKNGKEAGHILMTTPTESTSSVGHQTSFTHHVNEDHIKHALANKGEYQIDAPEEQEKAKGKEYAAPQAIKFYAEGGSTGDSRHPGLGHDDFHAFPERNYAAMRHLTMRRGEDEEKQTYHSGKKATAVDKSLDTMRLALIKKAK